MHHPLVSIISPTYNHEKFIAGCIESVLAQSYTNWEMIIIDDGSSDRTFSIAKDYSEKDHRIKAFTQENVGIFRLFETYNSALNQAKGKYVAVLECDDLWLPHKLETQVQLMEQNPHCVLSWGKAYLSSIDLKTTYYLAPQNLQDIAFFNNKPTGSFLRNFIFNTLIPALTIFIRKESLLEIGGFQSGYDLPLVDIPTTLELLAKGEFIFVDEPLGHWRIYPNQVTKTYTGQMALGYYKMMKSFLERYPQIITDNQISHKEIEKHLQSRLVISFSRSGRYKLIRKDFKNARKDYIYSIIKFPLSEPVWKLRSAVGLLLSFFRLDVEWLARFIGNASYK